MARPSILGNDPPTEAEVNHALECCKAVPRIREELLGMEQEMSDIRERLGILRRASVRGKELPPVLKAALERQAAAEESA